MNISVSVCIWTQYTATVYDTVHDYQLSLLLPRETKSLFANFTFSNEHES